MKSKEVFSNSKEEFLQNFRVSNLNCDFIVSNLVLYFDFGIREFRISNIVIRFLKRNKIGALSIYI